MKSALLLLISFALAHVAFAEGENKPPRWLLLGDDDALTETFVESDNVFLVCIYQTVLENMRVPFVTVVHKATVVQVLKGDIKVGDKVEIAFSSDSLPENEEMRDEFIEKANSANQGRLRFVFPYERKEMRFATEFLYVPTYTVELSDFLKSLAAQNR